MQENPFKAFGVSGSWNFLLLYSFSWSSCHRSKSLVLDQLNAQFMFKVGILFAAGFDKKCRCFWKKGTSF